MASAYHAHIGADHCGDAGSSGDLPPPSPPAENATALALAALASNDVMAITKRSISGSEKSAPAKHQQSKRLRCAAIVFNSIDLLSKNCSLNRDVDVPASGRFLLNSFKRAVSHGGSLTIARERTFRAPPTGTSAAGCGCAALCLGAQPKASTSSLPTSLPSWCD